MTAPAADATPHLPVLLDEVIGALAPRSLGRYIDGTLGAGGHASALLDAAAPGGRLLGLDADPAALELARERLAPFGGRTTLAHANFRDLAEVAGREGFVPADGVLLDLGLSSMQLDLWRRGFSFRRDEPLDMRFDPTTGPTAAELIRELPEDELADAIWRLGEEPASRRIARAIKRNPPDAATELAETVERAVGGRRGRIHPATQTFQALRILVNDELGALREGLRAAVEVLRPGGRLAVIAFHSLEDRIVKEFLRAESAACVCPPERPVCTCAHTPTLRLLGRRAIKPGAEEERANPRSRSARLRAAERTGTDLTTAYTEGTVNGDGMGHDR